MCGEQVEGWGCRWVLAMKTFAPKYPHSHGSQILRG